MKQGLLISLCVMLVVTTAPFARAQIGGAYDLSWNTIDPGGAMGITGGVYTLGGTIGQIDAGVHTGGVYIVTGGFWASALDAATDVPLDELPSAAPTQLALHSAIPNPFDRETAIAFDLPQATRASARIYDASGSLVRTLIDESIAAGRHEVVWSGTNDDGSRVAQGIYLLRLEAGSETATRKLVLTR